MMLLRNIQFAAIILNVAFGLFACKQGTTNETASPRLIAARGADTSSTSTSQQADVPDELSAELTSSLKANATPANYITTAVSVGVGSNILVGDNIYAELDAKMEGTDTGYEAQPYFLIQRQDGKLLAYNTDISPFASGKRTTILGVPVTAGDGNTITSAVQTLNVNLYNLKSTNFKLTVYGVRLYVIRGGKKITIKLPDLSSWTNVSGLSKQTEPAIPARSETVASIPNGGYMSVNLPLSNYGITLGDKLYAEINANLSGSDAGFQGQAFFIMQAQNSLFYAFDSNIAPYANLGRVWINSALGVASAINNTIANGTTSVYVNLYNNKGPTFNLSVYAVNLYVMRNDVRINLATPALSQWTKSKATTSTVKSAAVPAATGYLIAALADQPAVPAPAPPIPQKNILTDFPKIPKNYAYFDFKQRTKDFVNFIMDWSQPGIGPTVAWNNDYIQYGKPVFTMADYYGDQRLGFHNLLDDVAIVFSSSVVGTDMTAFKSGSNTYDYLDQLSAYWHPVTKTLVLQYYQPDFSAWWFDVTANALYFMLGDIYPNAPGMDSRLQGISDSYYNMIVALGGPNANFDYTGYSFTTGKTDRRKDSGINTIDAGLGMALVEYYAFKKFGDPKYLTAAKWALDYYEKSTTSKFYDNFTQFGPYIAARINAETGTNYSTTKYIDWIRKNNRDNLGAISKSYGGWDYYGLAGMKVSYGKQERAYFYESTNYAFMLPAVKYDASLALPLAKWMLNASSNMRAFFPDQNTADKQASGSRFMTSIEHVIPHEALEVQSAEGVAHYTESDNDRWKNDPNYKFIVKAMGPTCTNLSIYSGVWMGLWGAIINKTNVDGILKLDVNKLDFFSKSYPTFLYYNPFDAAKQVHIDLTQPSDLYDVISGRYLAQNVSNTATFTVPANNVVQLVVAPAGSVRTYDGNKTLLNGVVAAYQRP